MTTATTNSTLVFNKDTLEDLISCMDESELAEFMSLFEPSLTPKLNRLIELFTPVMFSPTSLYSPPHTIELPYEEINELAHALGGLAACYGLVRLSCSAKSLEQSTLVSDFNDLLDSIAPSVAALTDWYTTYTSCCNKVLSTNS